MNEVVFSELHTKVSFWWRLTRGIPRCFSCSSCAFLVEMPFVRLKPHCGEYWNRHAQLYRAEREVTIDGYPRCATKYVAGYY